MATKCISNITIVGGGIAGSSAALLLAQSGLHVTLYEKGPSLVSGPPFCHLHAGGNLYPEISDAQCLKLLEQSIAFARLYPHGVDYRPTIIAVPTHCTRSPQALLPRLEMLTAHYQHLIAQDPANAILGDPGAYYKCYDKATITALQSREIVPHPTTLDEWMIPFAKRVDLEKLQFPILLVQEYGLNLFRIGAGEMLALQAMPNVTLKLNTEVTHITPASEGWQITTKSPEGTSITTTDYLINATGFLTGKIDDMIGVPCQRLVEFKAAYISQWGEASDHLWPEIIFHGERGTPDGMGQFTPYPEGYFQLHGMTPAITLYEDGLVASTPQSCQPQLPQHFVEKILHRWEWSETQERTERAIAHLGRFIPSFHTATVGSHPLFGAQQIPGDDPTLRVAEVSFPTHRYARAEIVKVSSVIDMCRAIVEDLKKYGEITEIALETTPFDTIDPQTLDALAQEIAQSRDYPAALGRRSLPRPTIR